MWEFDGYRLRMTQPEDVELAAEWMKSDPEHDGRFPPTYWLEKNPSTDGMVLEGEDGKPVLFLRIERYARIHVQFPPMGKRADKIRVAKAIDKGLTWMINRLGVLGFCGMIFSTRVPELAEFFRSRFGFYNVTDTFMCKPIAVYTPPNYRHMAEPLGEDEKVN